MHCELEPDRVKQIEIPQRLGRTKFLLLVGGTLIGTALGMFGGAIDVAALMGYNPEQLLATHVDIRYAQSSGLYDVVGDEAYLRYNWLIAYGAMMGGALGGFGTLALLRRLCLFQWDFT